MRNFLQAIYGVFAITSIITHLWTTIIGFTEGGFFGGVITLFLPALSEVYWLFAMMGENNFYVVIALIHTVLAFLYFIIGRNV